MGSFWQSSETLTHYQSYIILEEAHIYLWGRLECWMKSSDYPRVWKIVWNISLWLQLKLIDHGRQSMLNLETAQTNQSMLSSSTSITFAAASLEKKNQLKVGSSRLSTRCGCQSLQVSNCADHILRPSIHTEIIQNTRQTHFPCSILVQLALGFKWESSIAPAESNWIWVFNEG